MTKMIQINCKKYKQWIGTSIPY